MKIAVTGASGHVGSNLSRMLIDQDHQVKAFIQQDVNGLAAKSKGIKKIIHFSSIHAFQEEPLMLCWMKPGNSQLAVPLPITVQKHWGWNSRMNLLRLLNSILDSNCKVKHE